MNANVNITNSVINLYIGVDHRQNNYNRVYEKIQEGKDQYNKLEVLTDQKRKTAVGSSALAEYYKNKGQYGLNDVFLLKA